MTRLPHGQEGAHDLGILSQNGYETRMQTLNWGREGRKARRETKENDLKQRRPTETQGPREDLRGTCIKALTVSFRLRLDGVTWECYLARALTCTAPPNNHRTN